MKLGWITLGILLFLIAGVIAGAGFLYYLLAQGTVMSIPTLLLIWISLFGVFAAVGGIAWLAGWLPRKEEEMTREHLAEMAEPETQTAAVEAPIAEPIPIEEVIPKPELQSPAIEAPKTEPINITETIPEIEEPKTEPINIAEITEPEPQTAAVEIPKAEPIHLQEITREPRPQRPVIETPKAEPRHVAEEKTKTRPRQRRVRETADRGSRIIDIEGIGPVHAEKLNSIDIYTTSELLKAGGTPLGRRELVEKTGIAHNLILKWVNIADLFRIKGVGEEYSELLEAAGVDTVVELAKRVPENLHAKMLEVNEKKELVRRPPTLSGVEQWIKEAKKLPRKIEY
jgi:predicted flap endonuclease-1-like 5' DNA nuclease